MRSTGSVWKQLIRFQLHYVMREIYSFSHGHEMASWNIIRSSKSHNHPNPTNEKHLIFRNTLDMCRLVHNLLCK